MSSLAETVALSLVPGLGPITYKNLIRKFGSAAEVFKAKSSELLWVRGVSDPKVQAMLDPSLFEKAKEEIDLAHQEQVQVLTQADFPENLKQIYAPPIVLYIKGNIAALGGVKIAVVGSRDASIYGRQTASLVAKELTEAGVTVVSGMAMGIDCAAHEGALAAGGPTVAVLACGLSRISNGAPQDMAKRIVDAGGVVVSEYPMRMCAEPGFFPVRNRIISGLASGVLVVEAKAKSGALITADTALEEGREVYAIPGNVDSVRSQGTLALLKQGAKLVTSAADILQDLDLLCGKPRIARSLAEKSRVALSEEENSVLSLLGSEPRHVDELIEHTALPPKSAISALSYLEIKGYVKQLPGKNYVAVK